MENPAWITADWQTLMRQAWMTAGDYMDNAVMEIDREVRPRVRGEKPGPGRGLHSGCRHRTSMRRQSGWEGHSVSAKRSPASAAKASKISSSTVQWQSTQSTEDDASLTLELREREGVGRGLGRVTRGYSHNSSP